MKYQYSSDKDEVNFVKDALRKNDGYCPSVVNSRGDEDFKCPCKNFRENAKKHDTCLCGLYVKVKD